LSHIHDITEQRRAEEKLREYQDRLEELVNERTADLEKSHQDLEEMNAALNVILKQRENDKSNLEENIVSNIKISILPYIEKIDATVLKQDQKEYLSIIKSHLRKITSPFLKRLSSQFLSLTTNEIKIASMIREGKTSKEIAEIMNISLNTVHAYRYKIRMKAGLKNNKVNLRSYLQSMD
jgi:DNA-binding CsgD family transcriptional regulator